MAEKAPPRSRPAGMFSPFERMLAIRYLRARKEGGFLSIIAAFSISGIALGVATLIIVMAVMNGYRAEMLQRILGLNGHLAVYPSTNRSMRNYEDMVRRIRGIEGVARVTPIVQDQVMATVKGRTRGALVRGVAPDQLRQRRIVADNIRAGSLDRFKGTRSIIVGTGFAEFFGLRPGDRIRLMSRQTRVTAFGSVPRVRTYRIAATFEIGMHEYDNQFVYMPLRAAQLHFRSKGAVSHLEVGFDDPERSGELTREVIRMAGAPVRLIDWKQANANFFQVVEVQRNVLLLVLGLIILVAALNIVSGLIMLVKDKGRDVAILRTMGAGRGAVMRVFLLAGSTVGVIGTTAGVLLGVVVAYNIDGVRRLLEAVTGVQLFSPEIYLLTRMPSRIDVSDVTGIAVMALALSFLATIYPAWRAARLDPVEGLRYE